MVVTSPLQIDWMPPTSWGPSPLRDEPRCEPARRSWVSVQATHTYDGDRIEPRGASFLVAADIDEADAKATIESVVAAPVVAAPGKWPSHLTRHPPGRCQRQRLSKSL